MTTTETRRVTTVKKRDLAPSSRAGDRARRPAWRIVLVYLALLGGALVFLLPLYWLIVTAFKGPAEISQFPPTLWPQDPRPENFVEALTAVPFMTYIQNSLIYAGISVVAYVFSSSLVAYAFAHIRFRYREQLFVLILATMMIPAEVQLIPRFILFSNLGWVNTYLPLIVPTLFGGAFYIFLLRVAFRNISGDVINAAKLDGASHFRIWWSIVLPMSRPALATVAIFAFMNSWNEFLEPLVYLDSNDLYTVSLGLAQYTAIEGLTNWSWVMAAALVVLAPCALVFFIAQKQIVQSVAVSAGQGSK
jgi:ABC-type glycerol-3-phosphate transport system permease component